PTLRESTTNSTCIEGYGVSASSLSISFVALLYIRGLFSRAALKCAASPVLVVEVRVRLLASAPGRLCRKSSRAVPCGSDCPLWRCARSSLPPQTARVVDGDIPRDTGLA